MWAKAHIKVAHIFYFITFLFISNFLISVYQKYAVAHKNYEGQEVDLPNIDNLPNDIATYEIKPKDEKVEAEAALPIPIKKLEENEIDNKDPVIKMCGQTISKPITQISSTADPLKPGDYFHIISRGQQTICISDVRVTARKNDEILIEVYMGKKETLRNVIKVFEVANKLKRDILAQYDSEFEMWQSKDNRGILTFGFTW